MKKNRYNCGETLVEVMVSIVIFLLLIAVLQGSVSFCTKAQNKSRDIRNNTESAIEANIGDITLTDGKITKLVYTSGSKNRNKGERAEFRYTGRKKGRYHSVPD